MHYPDDHVQTAHVHVSELTSVRDLQSAEGQSPLHMLVQLGLANAAHVHHCMADIHAEISCRGSGPTDVHAGGLQMGSVAGSKLTTWRD